MKKIKTHLNHDLMCAKHSAYGPLPCPWPNCKNGIQENEFEQEYFFKSETTIVHTRRKWKSPFGGAYYSWDNSKLANWFGLMNVFWREVERQKISADLFPKMIYHYSSLEGFLGVVKNRSIWMSDYSYLNDSRELTYGIDLISEAITRISTKNITKTSLDLLRTLEKKAKTFQNRICIASFSVDGDSLSQWRAYGPIAIGFSARSVALHVNQSMTRAVVYDPDAQMKMVTLYLHHICQTYETDMRSELLTKIPDVYESIERFLELIVFFKDPAFKVEKEYRLAYVDNHEILKEFKIKPPPKLFRISKNRIVPYVSSTDILPSKERNFPLEITEIVLGPDVDSLLERGIREFLDSEGLSEVAIRHSTVPFRS